MGVSKDFSHFRPSGYLKEQYDTFSLEERFILRFLHDTYRDFGRKKLRILELGGGPTIYQLISASKYARAITFTDFLESNVEAVRQWVRKSRGAQDWEARFRFVAELEGARPKALAQRLRSTLTSFSLVNVLGGQSPFGTVRFDVVSSHFCAESIVSKAALFRKAMRFIGSHVTPGGMLIMSFLKEAQSYSAGGRSFAAYSLNEKELRNIVRRIGFLDIEIQTLDIESDGEQNAIMCLRARKRR